MGLLHSAVAQWLSTVFWFLFGWVSLISEETWLPISGHHLISMFHLPPKIPFFSLVCICVVICDSWGYEPCSKHLLDQEDVDMVNSLDKEKGITLEDFKLIKMHMANCMISFFSSFFNLYHTCIYSPYATALFCSLTFCFWLLHMIIIRLRVDVVSGSEFVVAAVILSFVC